MHIKCFAVASGLAAMLAVPVLAHADGAGVDWPHWRGPNDTGASPETGWSAEGHDTPLWTKKLGFGHSSFAVADGRLFALGYDLDRKLDVVHCLDPVTGETKWTHTYPAEFWNEGHDGGTCTTPAVHGDTVYTSNREGKLFALDAESGAVRWSHDMMAELDVTPPRWGFSGSPYIVDGMVVANVGKVAAYDAASGELKWVTDKAYGNAYSTPTAYDFNGRDSVLVLNGLGLAVIDRTDGSEIAFYDWTQNPERAVYGAPPVVIGDRIFISAASGGGCVMLEPNADDGLDVVWESRAMRNNYAGSVLHQDHLYGFDASVLKCIDLEGNETWRERGIGVGGVIAAGGRLVVIGAKGELIVAEANPQEYVELSRRKVLDGGAYWATPVLSHGLIYVRNSLGDMVCMDHRDGPEVRMAADAAPAELPAGDALLARHVEAIGGADALQNLQSLRLTGKGEVHGGGPIEHTKATLVWTAAGGFGVRFESGLDFGYNPELGWSTSQQGPTILEPDQIARLREVGDLHRMLKPRWGYASVDTTATRVLDARRCYVARAETADGGERTLYFEVDSGLLAGWEGPELPLWIFDEYEPVAGVKVPMEWSQFAPGSGSMTHATFSDAVVNRESGSGPTPPELIQMLTRSDEEKERLNEELREKHGDLTGSYELTTGSMAGTPITISIGEGALRLAFGPNPPDFLTEPDEQNRLYVMTNPQLYLQVEPAEGDGEPAIVLFAWGEEFGKLGKK